MSATSLWITAALARSALRRQQRKALQRPSQQLNDYAIWQRRLIRIALLCARRAEGEASAAIARATAKRERRKLAARVRRAGKTRKPAAQRSGRPQSVEMHLLRAAVDEHRARGVTYHELARFIVKSIAPHFLPPELGKRVVGVDTPAKQVLRLSQRLRKTAARYPPARQ